MIFICYSKCSTCKAIEKMMEEKGLTFSKRDIKEENPSAEELRKWHQASGLDLVKFYNTSGQLYRQNNIKEKRESMSLDEQYELLAQDGMLVKRPILLVEDQVYVGPMVKKYLAGL